MLGLGPRVRMAMATGLASLRIPVNAEIGYYSSRSALDQGGVGLTDLRLKICFGLLF
jgi:hypothetical protein